MRLASAMLTSPFALLIIVALAFSLASLVWPQKGFLGPIALLLICIALLIGRNG